MSEKLISVRFLNHFGGGFAEDVQVVEGTTVGEFVKKQLHKNQKEGGDDVGLLSNDSADYKIRHNRAPAVATTVLVDGDLLVLVPIKQEGA